MIKCAINSDFHLLLLRFGMLTVTTPALSIKLKLLLIIAGSQERAIWTREKMIIPAVNNVFVP